MSRKGGPTVSLYDPIPDTPPDLLQWRLWRRYCVKSRAQGYHGKLPPEPPLSDPSRALQAARERPIWQADHAHRFPG